MSFPLPKWPACVVIGDKVTEDQAAEIILKTSGLDWISNDRLWDKSCYEICGVEYDNPDDWNPNWESRLLQLERLGILDISMMTTDRIASSYVGGPNGWINWDGTIHQTNKNIGKWPVFNEVLKDWQKIAAEFPFITLKSQLFDGEYCEEGIEPVVEFKVCEGMVTFSVPTETLTTTGLDESFLLNRFTNPFAEQGCTIEQLQHAVSLCTKEN